VNWRTVLFHDKGNIDEGLSLLLVELGEKKNFFEASFEFAVMHKPGLQTTCATRY